MRNNSEILTYWCDINSGTDNLDGLRTMHAALTKEFACLDGNIEEIPLPPFKQMSYEGIEHSISVGSALRITKRPEAPFRVLLGGHMDTVYHQSHSFQKVEKIENGQIYGPGTADMKGGLLVMLKALKIIESHHDKSKLGWQVLITADEEIGSPASEPLWLEGARSHDIGILFEPSFPDGGLVSERKGSGNFIVIAKGRPAHSGRDFHQGRNAITALARFAVMAEMETSLERDITVNIGRIHGGGPVNIVPEFASCGINVRVKHNEDFQYLAKKFQELADKEGLKEGITLTIYPQTQRPAKPFNNVQEPLFKKAESIAHEMKIPFKLHASGGVCDGNILAAAGLPVIDTLGVVGGAIHTPQEYAVLDSIDERAEWAANLMMRLSLGEKA